MALEGTFHDTSLVELFEIFRMGNKTGVLRLSGPSQHSTIHVTLGRLIDAAVYDASTQQLVVSGDDAVLHMLKWSTAEFSFAHDPAAMRHPVTIFLSINQLVQLSAEASTPTPPTTLPHMAMPIAANLAFIGDLAPAADTDDQQISRHYRRLSTYSTAYDLSVPAQVSRLDILPLADAVQRLDMPALGKRVADPESTMTQLPQAAQPPRAAMSAGRKLLAAVLRRVRTL